MTGRNCFVRNRRIAAMPVDDLLGPWAYLPSLDSFDSNDTDLSHSL